MTRRVSVILCGGLGNQLFQIAAGLFESQDGTLLLDVKTGCPRIDVSGKPEVLKFNLPSVIDHHYLGKDSHFRARIFLFLLKVASKTWSNGLINIFYVFMKDFFEKITRLIFREGLFLANGVGFDVRLRRESRNRVLIGAFHTYKYLCDPQVFNQMREIEIHNSPKWLKVLTAEAQETRPIIVHIRRGDYLEIPELGILDRTYFLDSIRKCHSEYPSSNIWVFSDDFAGIESFIPQELISRTVYIDFDQTDAASNLQAMREGQAYVISNSTFSWWGAMLSQSRNPLVICPKEWFKTKSNPKHLLPSNWIKVSKK